MFLLTQWTLSRISWTCMWDLSTLYLMHQSIKVPSEVLCFVGACLTNKLALRVPKKASTFSPCKGGYCTFESQDSPSAFWIPDRARVTSENDCGEIILTTPLQRTCYQKHTILQRLVISWTLLLGKNRKCEYFIAQINQCIILKLVN